MKKKLLSFAAALCFIVGAKAQTSYGIKAGVNFPKMTFSMEGISASNNASTSFYVGGYIDAPIATNLSVQPGLSLQGKGGKYDEQKTSLMYLELPVNFVYYVPAGSGNIFLGAGPYAGYALSGKVKEDGQSMDIEFGDEGMKRFDAGLNFLAGYKLSNGFLINGGYSLGIVDLGGFEGASLKNRVFSVGIGYQF